MEAAAILRAAGDNHVSAHALGYPVLRIRMFAVMFGGACAGLAGAYLPLAYTPFFTPGMTPDADGSRWRWWCSRRGGPGVWSSAHICSAPSLSFSCTRKAGELASRRNS